MSLEKSFKKPRNVTTVSSLLKQAFKFGANTKGRKTKRRKQNVDLQNVDTSKRRL
jgi:hypothetical protein